MGLEIVEPKERLLSFEELKLGVIYVGRGEYSGFNGVIGFDGDLCQKICCKSSTLDSDTYLLIVIGSDVINSFVGDLASAKLFQELPSGSVINYTK